MKFAFLTLSVVGGALASAIGFASMRQPRLTPALTHAEALSIGAAALAALPQSPASPVGFDSHERMEPSATARWRWSTDRDDSSGILLAWGDDSSGGSSAARFVFMPQYPAEYAHTFQQWRFVHAGVIRVSTPIGGTMIHPMTRLGLGLLVTQVPLDAFDFVLGTTVEVLGWEEGADVHDDGQACFHARLDGLALQ